jgi:hypothetical protein
MLPPPPLQSMVSQRSLTPPPSIAPRLTISRQSPEADACAVTAQSKKRLHASSVSEPFFPAASRHLPQPKHSAFVSMDHVLGLVGKDFVLIAADMKVAHSVLTMKSDQDK